ncbi:MAG: hypothetical protein ACKORY_05275, partial [Actinomycetota bacterium]
MLLVGAFFWLTALGGRTRPLSVAVQPEAPRQPVLSARRTPDVLSFVTRSSRPERTAASPAPSLLERVTNESTSGVRRADSTGCRGASG